MSDHQSAEAPEYLTVSEAADLLRCSHATLARQRAAGTGVPFAKFGRRVLYRRSDIETYLAGQLRYSNVSRHHPQTGALPPGTEV